MKKSSIVLIILSMIISCVVMAQSPNRLGGSNNVWPASGEAPVLPSGGGTNLVVDGGFEGGSPNAAWTEASTNFGSPICDTGLCGTGTGTGPNNGTFWSWFGGAGGALETASVSQMITIPPGIATLEFSTELIVCDSADDFMEARIDGTMVYRVQGDDAACGNLGYVMQSVDVSAFADGGTHNLEFFSDTVGTNGGGTNFFLDDVSLAVVVPAVPVPSLQWYAIVAMFLILLAIGYRKSRA